MSTRSKICVLFTMLWTAFIFSNSLKVGSVSNGMSKGIVSFVVSLAEKIGFTPDPELVSVIVRKSGHVIEFLLLAVLITLCYTLSGKSTKFYGFTILFFCLLVAVSDEFIQTFVANRSGDVRDIAIDFGGSLAGFIIVSLTFSKKRFKRRRY